MTKKNVLWLFAVLGVVIPSAVSAGTSDFALATVGHLGDANTFGQLAYRAISILLFLAGAAAVLYLLWSGFQYITAGGDDEKAGNARKGIVNAIIGVVIVSAAFLIFNASRKVVDKAQESGVAPTDL